MYGYKHRFLALTNTMRKFGKREWTAIAAALVATAILFYGGSIWRFLFGQGVVDSTEGPLRATQSTEKMTNISTVEGIEIYVVQEGTGAEALPGKTVTAHYVGTLADGTKFDSSLDRGQPFSFKLGAGQVIRGWDLGIQGMKVGEVRRLIISPAYGYGSQAIGPIPPNSTLTFEVQLVNVE
jgi:FKBP-type peptidyl-prolyl cis-trans isomerase